jgi:hypothetical protein
MAIWALKAGRQRRGGGFTAIDVQRDFFALGGQRQVLPLAGVQRLGGHGALAVDLHERHALVDAHQQAVGAVAAGQNSCSPLA